MTDVNISINNPSTTTLQISVEKTKKISFFKIGGLLLVASVLIVYLYQVRTELLNYGMWCLIGLFVYSIYKFLTSINKVTIIADQSKGIELIKESTSIPYSNIEFIPKEVLNNVIIHEQIQIFVVETYLALTFKSKNVKYITKFPPLKPIFYEFNLSIKQKQLIYQSLHQFLKTMN
ncbi:hypothetical protein ENUP19_0121G0184 [Entamoeba nuttalli]|uniref:Uncharacterized protein n=2 Tax=Entamoeba nuttalli TaxID=412467 RepID=K2GWD7_ENTNP|nr:hypothetical protein ENU1_176550 [Entamoeba nuttalli P19]EKE38102.1 hypothetical protein ENU1_176550 [Entamoeba nuttalli P19]|eukprot:XP_008859564.1 hypothetical protein ENU1_176550 [Entamoeba nuttalli P19]